jgi:alpha-glucosidase
VAEDSDAPWWKTAVVYQIYPRSFAVGDPAGRERRLAEAAPVGVGDLDGIRRHLDYVDWLGASAIWLSPFFRSPMADFGYDVSDYCDVDPLFGTLDDFDALVEEAHRRDLRVLIDWVPNHTSDQHPWFLESRSSRHAPKRDWYVWVDGTPDRPPNNWTATFVGGPAWTWDEPTGQWYLHLFLPEQPDLNWSNPEVVQAMRDVLRFWLDRGVDGFRVDVVHALGKDTSYPDAPDDVALIPWSALNDHPSTHAILRDLRRLVDSYPGDRVLVGEVFLLSTAKVARYYGADDELHLCFNFPPLFAPWEAEAWRKRIRRVEEELNPRNAWPTWVLSNHDNPRHRTRYGTDARARVAAVLLLSLRGTPFVYAGEELGLEDAVVPPERVVDPGGRDGCRAPLPWDASPTHGWDVAEPWLPWPPHVDRDNVAAERDDPGSMLNLYRRLLAARAASPALRQGTWSEVASPAGTIVFERRRGSDRRLVALNYTGARQQLGLPDPPSGRWTVEVSTAADQDGQPFAGHLEADTAVILR